MVCSLIICPPLKIVSAYHFVFEIPLNVGGEEPKCPCWPSCCYDRLEPATARPSPAPVAITIYKMHYKTYHSERFFFFFFSLIIREPLQIQWLNNSLNWNFKKSQIQILYWITRKLINEKRDSQSLVIYSSFMSIYHFVYGFLDFFLFGKYHLCSVDSSFGFLLLMIRD